MLMLERPLSHYWTSLLTRWGLLLSILGLGLWEMHVIANSIRLQWVIVPPLSIWNHEGPLYLVVSTLPKLVPINFAVIGKDIPSAPSSSNQKKEEKGVVMTFPPISKQKPSQKEPSNIKDWYHARSKGCFHFDEEEKILAHQYVLEVAVATKLWLTVKPTSVGTMKGMAKMDSITSTCYICYLLLD